MFLFQSFPRYKTNKLFLLTLCFFALTSMALLVISCKPEKTVSPEENSDNKGTLSGQISELYTNSGVAEITVTTEPGGYNSSSNQEGKFAISGVPAGTYTLRYQHTEYADTTVSDVKVFANAEINVQSISLRPLYRIFSGRILGKDSIHLTKVALKIGTHSTVTDSLGNFFLKAPRTNSPLVLSHKFYKDTTLSPPSLEPSVATFDLATLYMLFQKDGYVMGKVSNDSGVGLPTITVLSSSGHQTTTNDNGLFSLPVIPGTHSISFLNDSYKTDSVTKVIVTSNDTVTLNPISLLRVKTGIGGTLADRKTGAPLADVLVTEPISGATTRTLSNGVFFFADLMPATYTLSFSHPLYIDTTINDLKLGANETKTDLSVELKPKLASLAGVITDTAGNTISGVTVQPDSGTSVITTANGAYQLNQLPPGKRKITVRHDSYKSITGDTITLKPGENKTGKNFKLFLFTSGIKGFVYDTKNSSQFLNGALVKPTVGSIQTTTLSDGAFQLDELTPGNHILNVSHTDYFDTTLAPITLLADQKVTNVLVGLRYKWASMQFVLHDSTKQATVEGVNCYLNDSLYPQTSNTMGVVKFSKLITNRNNSPTEYKLKCAANSNYEETAIYTYQLTPNDNLGPITIQLQSTFGTLSGVITDTAGNTISGVTVQPDSGTSVITTANGAYQLNQLPPGKRKITVRHDSYKSINGDTITIKPGEKVTGKNFKLLLYTAGIKGFVYDTKNSSQFLTGALVKPIIGSIQTTTLGDGAFQLDGLTPGNHILNISHMDYFDTTLAPITLLADQKITNVLVGLRYKWASMQFTLRDSITQAPVANVNCRLNDDPSQSVLSNTSGRVLFNKLPTVKSGPTEYLLQCSGHAEYQATPYSTYNLNPGDSLTNITIKLKPYLGTFGGILLDTNTSEPIEGSSITIASSGRSTQSLANGRFKIDNLRPGKWKFSIYNPLYGSKIDSIDLKPSDNPSDTLHEYKLKKLRSGISGIIKDSRNNALVSGVIVVDTNTNKQFVSQTDGSYSLTPLSPGPHTLRFQHPNYFDTTLSTITLEADQPQNVNMVLRYKFADLNLVVIDSVKGTGINNASCTMDGTTPLPTGDNGRLKFVDISPGTHTIICSHTNYQTMLPKVYQVKAGDNIGPDTIKLVIKFGSISGNIQEIISTKNRILPNAKISIPSTEQFTLTDAQGKYRLENIYPGFVRFQIGTDIHVTKYDSILILPGEPIFEKNYSIKRKTVPVIVKGAVFEAQKDLLRLGIRITDDSLLTDTLLAFSDLRDNNTIYTARFDTPLGGINRKIHISVLHWEWNVFTGYYSYNFTQPLSDSLVVTVPTFSWTNGLPSLELFPGESNPADTTVAVNSTINIRAKAIDSISNMQPPHSNPINPPHLKWDYYWTRDSDGLVSYTFPFTGPNASIPAPSKAGVFTYTIRVFDSDGTGAEKKFNVTAY